MVGGWQDAAAALSARSLPATASGAGSTGLHLPTGTILSPSSLHPPPGISLPSSFSSSSSSSAAAAAITSPSAPLTALVLATEHDLDSDSGRLTAPARLRIGLASASSAAAPASSTLSSSSAAAAAGGGAALDDMGATLRKARRTNRDAKDAAQVEPAKVWPSCGFNYHYLCNPHCLCRSHLISFTPSALDLHQ